MTDINNIIPLECIKFNLKTKIKQIKILKHDILKYIDDNDIIDNEKLSQLCLDFFDLPYTICSKFKKYIHILLNINENGHDATFYNKKTIYKKIGDENGNLYCKVVNFINLFSFDNPTYNFSTFRKIFETNSLRNANEHGFAYIKFYQNEIISSTNNKIVKYEIETDKNKDKPYKDNVFENLANDIDAICEHMNVLDREFDYLVKYICSYKKYTKTVTCGCAGKLNKEYKIYIASVKFVFDDFNNIWITDHIELRDHLDKKIKLNKKKIVILRDFKTSNGGDTIGDLIFHQYDTGAVHNFPNIDYFYQDELNIDPNDYCYNFNDGTLAKELFEGKLNLYSENITVKKYKFTLPMRVQFFENKNIVFKNYIESFKGCEKIKLVNILYEKDTYVLANKNNSKDYNILCDLVEKLTKDKIISNDITWSWDDMKYIIAEIFSNKKLDRKKYKTMHKKIIEHFMQKIPENRLQWICKDMINFFGNEEITVSHEVYEYYKLIWFKLRTYYDKCPPDCEISYNFLKILQENYFSHKNVVRIFVEQLKTNRSVCFYNLIDNYGVKKHEQKISDECIGMIAWLRLEFDVNIENGTVNNVLLKKYLVSYEFKKTVQKEEKEKWIKFAKEKHRECENNREKDINEFELLCSKIEKDKINKNN